MTVQEIIDILKKYPESKELKFGFTNPHSYRGNYFDVAFVLTIGSTVHETLDVVNSVIGETFTGYKGGDYEMHEYTDCYLAQYGSSGEEVTMFTLAYMLDDASLIEEFLKNYN